MNWFFIALLGPIFYSLANHTDKYLISKYVKGGTVGSLIIFSALFSSVALPVIYVIHPSVFAVSFWAGVALAFNGMVLVASILCYFYALHKDEASHVVPLYQTVPIFGFILGFLILGETVSVGQGVASSLIIIGSLVLSFELGEKVRFRKGVVLFMTTASLLYAVYGVVYKFIALDTGFWTSTFWLLVGQFTLGIIFLMYVRPYRIQFLGMLREHRLRVLGLNSLSELLFMGAEFATQFATLLAPVALVLVVNSFQPLFVFIIGVFLALFFPHISQESLNHKHLLQKTLGIALIVIGGYFISN